MAKIKAAAAAAVAAVKRFTKRETFAGGDGAKVRVYARQSKHGIGFNTGVTLREPGKKALTGATGHADTQEEAMEQFSKLVALALESGFVPLARKTRAPKPPAFTIETFPKAKPFVGGPVVVDEVEKHLDGLAFPKTPAKKATAKAASKRTSK